MRTNNNLEQDLRFDNLCLSNPEESRWDLRFDNLCLSNPEESRRDIDIIRFRRTSKNIVIWNRCQICGSIKYFYYRNPTQQIIYCCCSCGATYERSKGNLNKN